MVNQQDTRYYNNFGFENSRIFPFPYFCFLLQLLSFNFRDKICSLLFSFEILRGKWARGRPKVIALRMPCIWPLYSLGDENVLISQ